MINNIFEEVLKAGIPFTTHCSDLYLWKNEDTQKLVNEYQYKSNVTSFKSETDDLIMYDIPFVYHMYHAKNKEFKALEIGEYFFSEGTYFVKKSTRTAYVISNKNLWFYFSKNEIVKG